MEGIYFHLLEDVVRMIEMEGIYFHLLEDVYGESDLKEDAQFSFFFFLSRN